MYICICVGITDVEIRKAIDDGHDTLDKLMYETGAGLGCGTCRSTLEDIINEYDTGGYRDLLNLDIPVIKSF